MRLAAEEKMGYFPVKHETIDLICQSLAVKFPSEIKILDPCCGAGAALERIGINLKVPKENLYGVELDEKRAEQAAERLGHVVHASFFNAKIVPMQSFSLLWLNPPYDNELKQEGRTSQALEVTFLEQAARYVEHGGVIILHCPRDRVTYAVKMAMNNACENVVMLELPEELRPYREAVLVGYKRLMVEKHGYDSVVDESATLPTYNIDKKGDVIRAFDRVAPTDIEILNHLERAPFWKMFDYSPPKVKLQPILPLGPGHLGLTLASGYLDGYFAPEGYEPHVVRGIAYKEEKIVKEEQSENDEGKVTTTTTKRENIKLKIRAVNGGGDIHEIK